MINKIRKLSSFSLLLLILFSTALAQVQNDPPMRQVLGTTGSTVAFLGGTIDYTVGEVMVNTDSATSQNAGFKWLTQGFQQPDVNVLCENAKAVNATCTGGKDGKVNLSGFNNTGTVKFRWMDESNWGTASLHENLPAGPYHYQVKDSLYTISGSVIVEETPGNCILVEPYKGFTPNGDGHNDSWVIEGISNFKKSKVSIFNRWGDLVWDTKKDNYENDNVFKGENNSKIQLSAATYFYIIELDDKVCNTCKGWVELTH